MPVYDDINLSSQQIRSSSPATGVPSGRNSPVMVYNPFYTGRPRTPTGSTAHAGIDRQEIIRLIKGDLSISTSPELDRHGRARQSTPRPESHEEVNGSEEMAKPEIGMQIERPRSALHRGDFREKEDSPSAFQTFSTKTQSLLSTSPPAPWHPQFPASTFRQAWHERRITRVATESSRQSLSDRHLFYQAPTSPLVHSSRPETPPATDVRRSSRSPSKQARRHTFSPQALQQYASGFDASRRSPGAVKPTLRKEATYPYQAHQPRRSLHALTVPNSPPRSSFLARRPSASDQHSPLQHAPMVGSYEESILRGRMSTTPSKPLNFLAQIGVLGKDECKPSLRCPPHVTVPFPAVFYSYGAGSKQGTNDQPSPYVGLVDLEHNLRSHEDAMTDRRRQRLEERLHAAISDDGSRASSRTRQDNTDVNTAQKLRLAQKLKRRSGSPKAPPGGSYRIPQQGQLQIVIKNPNKTAVKLFLIPYDLSDMLPGQKTFIRQRSYSAGPIIDMPMSSRKNYGTDRPEAALSNSDDPDDRPVLRYLVHLNICCTGEGRYWLYKSIRVVFANRVPDGKEKLRNEIQLPEPRYSSYKPVRGESAVTSLPSSPTRAAKMRKEVEVLRADANWMPVPTSLPSVIHDLTGASLQSYRFPSPALPLETLDSRPVSRDMMDLEYGLEASPLAPKTHNESLLLQRLRQLDMEPSMSPR